MLNKLTPMHTNVDMIIDRNGPRFRLALSYASEAITNFAMGTVSGYVSSGSDVQSIVIHFKVDDINDVPAVKNITRAIVADIKSAMKYNSMLFGSEDIDAETLVNRLLPMMCRLIGIKDPIEYEIHDNQINFFSNIKPLTIGSHVYEAGISEDSYAEVMFDKILLSTTEHVLEVGKDEMFDLTPIDKKPVSLIAVAKMLEDEARNMSCKELTNKVVDVMHEERNSEIQYMCEKETL